MERIYNIFVDNGIFAAAHYLNKKIENITLDDLKNNTAFFSELAYKFITCKKYSQIAPMSFNNSAYTQPAFKSKRLESIKSQFDGFFDNLGEDEICSICGKRQVKFYNTDSKYIKSLSRSIMPMLPANTFFNYSNNLQMVNVCPVCIFLSMISIVNMRKNGGALIIYSSDNDEFMYDNTYKLQQEVQKDIATDDDIVETSKFSNLKEVTEVIKWFLQQNKIYKECYIQAVSFYNGGQNVLYEENLITSKNLKILRKLQNKALLSEFEEANFFKPLIENRMEKVFPYFLSDHKEGKLICSLELFLFLKKEI